MDRFVVGEGYGQLHTRSAAGEARFEVMSRWGVNCILWSVR